MYVIQSITQIFQLVNISLAQVMVQYELGVLQMNLEQGVPKSNTSYGPEGKTLNAGVSHSESHGVLTMQLVRHDGVHETTTIENG